MPSRDPKQQLYLWSLPYVWDPAARIVFSCGLSVPFCLPPSLPVCASVCLSGDSYVINLIIFLPCHWELLYWDSYSVFNISMKYKNEKNKKSKESKQIRIFVSFKILFPRNFNNICGCRFLTFINWQHFSSISGHCQFKSGKKILPQKYSVSWKKIFALLKKKNPVFFSISQKETCPCTW